jgi:hypothetical protein
MAKLYITNANGDYIGPFDTEEDRSWFTTFHLNLFGDDDFGYGYGYGYEDELDLEEINNNGDEIYDPLEYLQATARCRFARMNVPVGTLLRFIIKSYHLNQKDD